MIGWSVSVDQRCHTSCHKRPKSINNFSNQLPTSIQLNSIEFNWQKNKMLKETIEQTERLDLNKTKWPIKSYSRTRWLYVASMKERERAFGAAIRGEVNESILNWLLHSNVIHGCERINRRRRQAATRWPFAQPLEIERVLIDKIMIRELSESKREREWISDNHDDTPYAMRDHGTFSKFTAHGLLTLVGNWFCCESKYIQIQNSSFSLHCFSF